MVTRETVQTLDGDLQFTRVKKYRLRRDYFYRSREFFYQHEMEFEHPYVTWTAGGIIIKSGFEWDGASGPTVDTRNTMRASLVHDALYECIERGVIDARRRKDVDREFRIILKQDGMSWIRRWAWYFAVRLVGGGYV